MKAITDWRTLKISNISKDAIGLKGGFKWSGGNFWNCMIILKVYLNVENWIEIDLAQCTAWKKMYVCENAY